MGVKKKTTVSMRTYLKLKEENAWLKEENAKLKSLLDAAESVRDRLIEANNAWEAKMKKQDCISSGVMASTHPLDVAKELSNKFSTLTKVGQEVALTAFLADIKGQLKSQSTQILEHASEVNKEAAKRSSLYGSFNAHKNSMETIMHDASHK